MIDGISRAGAVITVIRSAGNGGLDDRFFTESVLPFIRLYAPVSTTVTLADDGSARDIYTPVGADQLLIPVMEDAFYARFPSADIAVQCPSDRDKKLFLSDMDSTMIGQECIDELGHALDIGDNIAAITERAMRGEINFSDSLLERVALLKGADAAIINDVYRDRIRAVSGAATLLATLRARDVFCVLVSGGFTVFAEKVAAELGFHAFHANVLETENNTLTGRIDGDILRGETKAELLRDYMAKRGVSVAQTLALGDGANDLPMLAASGTGIALHAKPKVDEAAGFRIRYHDASAVLYVLGVPQADHVTA